MIADDADFTHSDDVEAALKIVKHAAFEDVQDAFSKMFTDLSHSLPRNGLINVKVSTSTKQRPKPRFGRRDLLRTLVCGDCGRDYGVFAIALFCPDCGAPNLHLHFDREIELVSAQISLAEAQKAEREELAYRLLGNAHEDVLTAFEAALKAIYLHRVSERSEDAPTIKSVKNDFQNIARTRERFELFALDPFATLRAKDEEILALNIQKRHVIGHNLSIADESFAERATDARIGETISLVGEDIRQFAELCQRVIGHLNGWLADDVTILAHSAEDRPITSDTVENNEANKDDNLVNGLGTVANRLGRWLSEMSPHGLTDPVDEAPLLAAFSDVEIDLLQEAIAELEFEGYLTTSSIGSSLPRMRPTADLFATFDPLVHGWNPTDDAINLVDNILNGGDQLNVAEFHVQIGWLQRRFNPALLLALGHIDERHVSEEMSAYYPARSFFLSATDKVALKRYVKQLQE